MSSPAGHLRVLYVAGSPRSGSTLLAGMIGQLLGGFFGGELWRIVPRITRSHPCGCGRLPADCPFWQRVGRVGFGGWSALDLDELVRLHGTVLSYRALQALLRPRLRPRLQSEIARFGEFTARHYAAIAEVSGAQLIVDSSKDPLYALLLRRYGYLRPRARSGDRFDPVEAAAAERPGVRRRDDVHRDVLGGPG